MTPTDTARVYISNYPAYDAGLVAEVDSTRSDVVTIERAHELLDQSRVMMDEHPGAIVFAYRDYGDHGSYLDYVDHEGIAWHVWVDEPNL
ncbi:hypothetical protein SEA_DIABLA_110 [Gordonia phage Diabla]|nr:hypothetical protein SEA_DIABLA_110 [Gordonia phage Diabla]